MVRLDTSLEAAGAEFLVLGNLLAEGIQSFKAYTNYPGYDIIATNPEKNRSCRVQVKSRWATDFNKAFPINNFDCDYVVLVALNRGFRYRKKATKDNTGRRSPEFYVLPVKAVKAAQRPTSQWGMVFMKDINKIDKYLDGWHQIKKYLRME